MAANIRKRRVHIGATPTQVVAIGRARGRTGPQVASGTCIVQRARIEVAGPKYI